MGKRLAILVAALLLAASAQAQWVMVGRAVAGRVQRMTQPASKEGGGYDVATVILEAPAERVYATAIKLLKANPQMKVTKEDTQAGSIEFRKGKLLAGINVSPLAEKTTQLVIASSAAAEAETGGTPLVVERVLAVCSEMKIDCKVQGN